MPPPNPVLFTQRLLPATPPASAHPGRLFLGCLPPPPPGARDPPRCGAPKALPRLPKGSCLLRGRGATQPAELLKTVLPSALNSQFLYSKSPWKIVSQVPSVCLPPSSPERPCGPHDTLFPPSSGPEHLISETLGDLSKSPVCLGQGIPRTQLCPAAPDRNMEPLSRTSPPSTLQDCCEN